MPRSRREALTEDGHAGQTYRLTSEDAYTAATSGAALPRRGARAQVFEGDLEAFREALIANGPASGMRRYDPLFREGRRGSYKPTDTAPRCLPRPPRLCRLDRAEPPLHIRRT